MSIKEQDPLQVVRAKKRSGRRTLLKSALLALGASALIQPSGGVLGLTQDAPKKEDRTAQVADKGTTDGTKKKATSKKGTKKKKKKKYEDTKKEGRR